MSQTTTAPAGNIFDRLTDALIDPRRARRSLLLLMIGYAVVWTAYAIVSRSAQDTVSDMAEMLIWTQHLEWGYPKHPPLPAYILRLWFSVFPVADWAYLLLAILTVTVGLYLAYELAGEWLAGENRVAAVLMLSLVPFYNFQGMKFDQNSLLIPLWTLAMWGLVRSLKTNSVGWAILCGAAAAAACLVKYWSAFLLLAMGLAVLCDENRWRYLRSPAPWAAVAVFIVLFAPHAVWLVQNDFPPLRWAGGKRRTPVSVGHWLYEAGDYVFGTLAYAIGALALLAACAKPSLAALRDVCFPPLRDNARRRAAILFYVPILAPIPVAAVTKTLLISLWNAPGYTMLPVMLMSSRLVALTREGLRAMVMVAVIFPLLVLAAAPVVAWGKLTYGTENEGLYARLAADAGLRAWRETTREPLRIMAGPFGLISTAAMYVPDRPTTFADFSPYLSPQVTPERIAREGAVLMSPSSDRYFMRQLDRHSAGHPNVRKFEVTLVRRWLGFESAPRKFTIAILPPAERP
ncbi:MAG: glycosyltransferase family 39 protein [Pseudorhodoplanes sp.]|nr:glycosyltransferase family 39 protein [Pseudorhodoplanes sp.]